MYKVIVSAIVGIALGLPSFSQSDDGPYIGNLNMYPNPTKNGVNIELDMARPYQDLYVEVRSVSGELVEKIELTENQNLYVDLTFLDWGIYSFNYYTEDRFIGSRKITKLH